MHRCCVCVSTTTCYSPIAFQQKYRIEIQGWFKKPQWHTKNIPLPRDVLKGIFHNYSGQIIVFHQPRFPWNSRGCPFLNASFWGPRDPCEGPAMKFDQMIAFEAPSFSSTPTSSRVIEVETKKSWAKAVVTLFLGAVVNSQQPWKSEAGSFFFLNPYESKGGVP